MSNVTAAARFADNPNNQEYVDVLIRVQDAICAGNDTEAGRLCDASIDLAESLSVVEVRWMQNLSSELESLCDEELLREQWEDQKEYNARLGKAWLEVENNPEAVLELLRFKQSILTPDRVAYGRARAYRLLTNGASFRG